MSSEALVEGPQGVVAAWETSGQVRFARIDPGSRKILPPLSAPGTGQNRKHPTLAVNGKGEILLAWTEGTGWKRGGDLAWQLYDQNGKPTAEKGRVEGGVPTWGLVTAVARPDGSFTLLH